MLLEEIDDVLLQFVASMHVCQFDGVKKIVFVQCFADGICTQILK